MPKKRRNYLRENAALGFLLSVVVLFAVPCSLAVLVGFVGYLDCLGQPSPDQRSTLLGGLMLLVAIGSLIGAISTAAQVNRKFEALPCVPPVREQLAVLPADEVLLRGSEMSAAAAAELLRAAHNADNSSDDGLLRAAHAGSPELSDGLLQPAAARESGADD